MIKNITDLQKYDFTQECRNCKYRKDIGLMEYCCSFVIELLEQERLNNLKRNIVGYILEDNLSKIDNTNILFDKDTDWTVSLIFKTNLREEKSLILRELRRALLDSPFFTGVNFIQGSLYKHEYGKEAVIVESTLDKYLKKTENNKRECGVKNESP